MPWPSLDFLYGLVGRSAELLKGSLCTSEKIKDSTLGFQGYDRRQEMPTRSASVVHTIPVQPCYQSH